MPFYKPLKNETAATRKRTFKGFNVLENNGFTTVKNRRGCNKDQTTFYEQISFRLRKNELRLIEQPPDSEPVEGQDPESPGRVFQFFDSVYREDQFETYRPIMEKRLKEKIKEAENDLAAATSKTARKKKAMASEAALKKYYNEWRRFQVSDHLPVWVELDIEYTDA